MFSLKALSVSIAATGAFATAATADFVDVAFTGPGPGLWVSVTANSVVYNTYAGQVNVNLSNSTGLNLDGNWTSYCAELEQAMQLNGSPVTYEIVDVADIPMGAPMGINSADAIARLYFAAGGAQFGVDSDFAAAFQVAIWELAYDYDGTLGSINLAAGDFSGSGFTLQTDIYLAILLAAAANPLGAQADLLGLANGDWQDQIIDVSGGIPAPGAISLLGVAGLVGSRRRRN